ncbi:uncharacterized protein F54H12.2-like [Pleurodeles waltl]|uniref:uncharacterized protein F54H12.2-like n=1 Tax=Pleurodeles waltl TaxID=8319 RepID=UPI00370991C4
MDMYLDLKNTLLHIICKIVKANGSNIANNAKVAMIAYPIAIMFNQMDSILGDQLITQNDNMYTYRTYIESILNYSCDALDTQLSAGLFYKDTYGNFEATALDGHNQDFVKRANFVTGSRQFDLLGSIHSDLSYHGKLLVNGFNLNIKLTYNKDSFCLISWDAEQYKLGMLSASLFVKRVSVTKRQTGSCRGPTAIKGQVRMERVALKIFSIPTGTCLTKLQNVFLGQLLKLLIIGFVDSTTFSGLNTSNPFSLKNYDINYAVLINEGAVIPAKLYTPSFGTSNFIKEYLCLVSITGKHLRDSGVVVSRDGYGAGYTLFTFDLTPDMEDGDHYNLILKKRKSKS